MSKFVTAKVYILQQKDAILTQKIVIFVKFMILFQKGFFWDMRLYDNNYFFKDGKSILPNLQLYNKKKSSV